MLKVAENCICSGDVNGQVYTLDSNSLQVVNSYTAHSAGMCDMDVVGNYLVTCGLAQQYVHAHTHTHTHTLLILCISHPEEPINGSKV